MRAKIASIFAGVGLYFLAGCDSNGERVPSPDSSLPDAVVTSVDTDSTSLAIIDSEHIDTSAIDTGGIDINPVNVSLTPTSVTPIDISNGLNHRVTFGAEPQYYKLSIEPLTSLTVIARGVGVSPQMYLSEEYMVRSCIIGQSSAAASSCVWSTNEQGEAFFSVAGPQGSQALVEVLIPPQNPPPNAPPTVQDIANVSFPTRITDGRWNDSESNYVNRNPHIYRISSLTPGLNYSVIVESPELDSVSEIAACLEFDINYAACSRVRTNEYRIDSCEPIDVKTYRCVHEASPDGELFVSVEPVFGAQFAEFSIDIAPLEGVYTGYYEGKRQSPVNITGLLPYTGGYNTTFSVSHYLVTGLNPGDLYKLSIDRHGDYFDRTSIQIGDGEPDYSRAYGHADASGNVQLELNVDRGTFDVIVEPPAKDRGQQSAPVIVNDSLVRSFVAEVGTGFSWYQIDNLVPNANYQITTLNRDVHSIVVHPNYGLGWPDSFVCGSSSAACSYPSGPSGSILIRIMDNGGERKMGGEVTITWTQEQVVDVPSAGNDSGHVF